MLRKSELYEKVSPNFTKSKNTSEQTTKTIFRIFQNEMRQKMKTDLFEEDVEMIF